MGADETLASDRNAVPERQTQCLHPLRLPVAFFGSRGSFAAIKLELLAARGRSSLMQINRPMRPRVLPAKMRGRILRLKTEFCELTLAA